MYNKGGSCNRTLVSSYTCVLIHSCLCTLLSIPDVSHKPSTEFFTSKHNIYISVKSAVNLSSMAF